MRSMEINFGNLNIAWKLMQLQFSEILAALCRTRGDLRYSDVHDLNDGLERRNLRRAVVVRRFLTVAESPCTCSNRGTLKIA